MFYLLLLFSLVTLGAGVFLIGFGIPIRETVFGSALLVSGTVALVGTFLLAGLAFAVRELQRVVHGVRRMPGPRPPRPVERKDAERRPPAQRPAAPRAGADAPIPPPTSIDEPPHESHAEARPGVPAEGVRGEPEGRPDPRPPARRPGPEWLRRAISEIEPVPGEPPPEPVAHHPDPRRHDEQPRRHGSGDVPFARPGPPGPERPPIQEGWLRPRGGPPAPMDPEDYAPEPAPDVRMRPRMPPAAQFDSPPSYEREPEPAPDPRVRARMPPAQQLEPPREHEPETLPDWPIRPRMPPAAQFDPPPGYEREPEPLPDSRVRPRMPPAPQSEPTPSHEYEPEPAPDVWMRPRTPPAPQPEPAPAREPEAAPPASGAAPQLLRYGVAQ